MKSIFFIFLTALLAASSVSFGQPKETIRDLQASWQIHNGTNYVPYSGGKSKAIFFKISAREGVGETLRITSRVPVSVFVNGQLYSNVNGEVKYPLDSLRGVLGRELNFAFYGAITGDNFSTHLVRASLIETGNVHEARPSSYFRDFVLTTSFIVLILLMAIIRLNPKLASDYFSVTKIFSLRESEDNILYSRVTSSGNFLFYGFSSLTIGFFITLLMCYLFEKDDFASISFRTVIVRWLIASVIVASVFIVKMMIVYLFATLFNLRDVAGMQFFNWVRLLFFMVGFSLIVLVLTIQTRNSMEAVAGFFYLASGILLVSWIVLAFFKIAAKARIGVFHLFSYLCVTEIIPSLIILKILYY